MDFHTLSRKDLQTLCKKNKIPANITNVAMADSLSALQHVEGLEEFLNGTLSSEATGIIGSPNAPKTACRTATRRKPTAVEEPDSSMQTLARTRRTTRRGVAEEAVAEPDTPAVQSSRQRKVAPMKSEIRPVQSAYSTRRSVRVLEKTMENLNLEEGSKSQSVETDPVPKESMADFSVKSNGSSEKEVSSDMTLVDKTEKPESESVDLVEPSEEKMEVEDEAMIEKDMTSHELQTALSNNFEAHREIETENRLAMEIPEEIPGQLESEELNENVTMDLAIEPEQENVAKISESEESTVIEIPATFTSNANAVSEVDSPSNVNSDSEASDFEAESEGSEEEEEESDDDNESDESESEASPTGANEEKSEQKISEQFPRPTLPTPTKRNRPEIPVITDILEDKPIEDENCSKDVNGDVAKKALEQASLRQLHKMLKNKLQTENAKKAQEETTRVALQMLPENL